MTISDDHISEIADLLDLGMICFYHRPTGTIESYPDLDDLYDVGDWQDIIDKVEADQDNYVTFEKMNSNEGFKVMEQFAYALADADFSDQLLQRLSNRKPFQNFKRLIDDSDYRQDWFDFKKEAYNNFVKAQAARID